MAINFPNSPSNGATHSAAGQTFTYDGTAGVWNPQEGTPVSTGTSAPSSPAAGDLWFDTSSGTLYFYYADGSSNQWVGVSGATGAEGSGAGVTSYANFAAFPSSGNSGGDLAFAQDTAAVYVWDGSAWDRMAAGSDESPVILTDPPTTHDLDHTGGTTTVTMTAQDPEGFDIEYGIAYNTSNNARPSQLSADTTINQTTGAYTFTPSSTGSDAGSFKARLSASDGVKSSVRTVDVALAFDALGELLLAAGGGGGNSYGGGGGGAGGLVLNTNYTFTAGVTNTIVIGTGGDKDEVQANRGDNGTDSTFTAGSTLVYTSVGGGGGGGYPADGLGDGGSGGGSGRALTGDNGSSTQNAYGGVGFGHDGSALTYSNKGGGGGGGAGGPGQGATSSPNSGGAGGAGKASTITGSSVFYCPGGPAGGYSTSIGSYVDGSLSSYGAGGNGGNYTANSSNNGADGVCIIATQQPATATTGSPTVDTSSRSGWYVYTFTSNGTITF
jgi:hypothetical protein